jgi:transposase
MHLEGASNVNIAKMVSLEQHAVGDYIRNYKAKGLPGLVMKHSTDKVYCQEDERYDAAVFGGFLKDILDNTLG